MNACVRAHDLTLLRRDKTVAAGLSFSAAPGERIAVLGANGSGKTTLARTLLGFSPYRGSLEIEGREVRDDPRAARKAAAAVFADPDTQLLMPTVHDELAFSVKTAEGRKDPAATDALGERFGLAGLLGRHPSELSSGEKRKVLLAQCIGRRPSILILDEPTADLDARGARRLQDTLAGLAQTIFLITHHYDLALALCRKAIVLGSGESATYADIRTLFDDRELLERWELV
ncbi:MAG: ABC transporter ATP-binding protein [Candidatus Aminicenantes bacterium]|nr:ABC transporter ATP-binding protein [Candidatus Aminicenantes bacterium]